MSRCPHCNEILSDDWVKRQGASLMGKKGGAVKARDYEQASNAARVRWGPRKLRTIEELRENNRARQRRYNKKHKDKKMLEKLCQELAKEAALLGSASS